MRFASLILTALSVAIPTAHAVIVLGPQGRNTSAPSEKRFVDSGWQYEGDLGDFSGTPIAPHFFITAQHLGFFPGSPFLFNGTTYTQTAAFSQPGTDLLIIQVDGTFNTYAPLFTRKTERGRQVMMVGRGTQRGDPVLVKKHLRGWSWGDDDHLRSWGINTVRTITSSTHGDLLKITFSPGASKDEGILSSGDSGGGMFIKDRGVYKLAGVNFTVDGPFSFTGDNGSGFDAALFNDAGLYTGDDDHWTLRHPITPSSAYTSRISSNLSWIDSVLDGTTLPDAGFTSMPTTSAVPEPPALALLVGAVFLLRRNARYHRK